MTTEQRMFACAEAEMRKLGRQIASRALEILDSNDAELYGFFLRSLVEHRPVDWTPELCAVVRKVAADPDIISCGLRARQLVLAIENYDPGPVPPLPPY